jgi:hypothetical protein
MQTFLGETIQTLNTGMDYSNNLFAKVVPRLIFNTLIIITKQEKKTQRDTHVFNYYFVFYPFSYFGQIVFKLKIEQAFFISLSINTLVQKPLI